MAIIAIRVMLRKRELRFVIHYNEFPVCKVFTTECMVTFRYFFELFGRKLKMVFVYVSDKKHRSCSKYDELCLLKFQKSSR